MIVEYTCDRCKGTFKSLREDDDALVEYNELFPEYAEAEKAVVCEDCWQELMEVY